MTDSEEFNNVTWDMQQDSLHHSSVNKLDPAALDPLSDMDQTLSQALDKSEELAKTDLSMAEPAHVNVDISDDPLEHSLDDNNKLHNSSVNSTYYYHSDQPAASTSSSGTEWKNIQVVDPRKENEGAYITYRIVSSKTSYRRRFQDFVWLYNVLYTHYPACFVPPLPDRHRMEYVKGDRFSTDFVERRRISLQRFLQRIARHPILRQAEFFSMFLESSEFNDASARALREGQETMIDTIGDSLLNAFAKIRKRDERFVQMKERADRLEDNLTVLEKTLARTNKRSDELGHDYDEFAQSVRGLVKHEVNVEVPLSKFAVALDEYSKAMKKMNMQDSLWLGEIHDYMSYNSIMKGVLKLRDQKQLDFEELSEYLQQTVTERERTLHPRPGDSTYNIAGYFTDKINEVRGADADKIRREKVLRLNERISELQDAIEQTHEVSTAFSEQVKREDDFLAQSKAAEMREALQDYTDAKVEFFEQGATIWREIVTTLEQME